MIDSGLPMMFQIMSVIVNVVVRGQECDKDLSESQSGSR
jgi:hypothetical protein